jgi:AmiR/NasT family two-component response regulator
MSAPPPVQNFRGLQTLILHAPDQNRAVLERTLRRLGLAVAGHDPAAGDALPDELARRVDLLFADADIWALPPLPAALGAPAVVALIGHETPSRLQRAYDMAACAFVLKPVRPHGVFTALFFAINERRRRSTLKAELDGMAARHAARRQVIKAILAIMARDGVDDEEAFRRLRRESMARRVTIEELCRQLVAEGGRGARRRTGKGSS